jgi:hypothetical protein
MHETHETDLPCPPSIDGVRGIEAMLARSGAPWSNASSPAIVVNLGARLPRGVRTWDVDLAWELAFSNRHVHSVAYEGAPADFARMVARLPSHVRPRATLVNEYVGSRTIAASLRARGVPQRFAFLKVDIDVRRPAIERGSL